MRGIGRLASGVLAALSASVLLALPAHADQRDVGSDTVSITVQIDPIECVTGCGPVVPGTDLPATGLASLEPLLWIAIALLVAGAVFALRSRVTRHNRALSAPAASTPYAVLSGERIPAVGYPSQEESTTRRTTQRGDRA